MSGLGRAVSVALNGLEPHIVTVEAHVGSGLPRFTLVGLPDTALYESRDRVRAACATAGFSINTACITVNLSPAALPKTGTGFDASVATALLAAQGHIDPAHAQRSVQLGELGLDGSLRPINGILPAVRAAREAGYRTVLVPAANTAEAQLVTGIDVVATVNLIHLVKHLGGAIPPDHVDLPSETDIDNHVIPTSSHQTPDSRDEVFDLSDIVGQTAAKEGLVVAAAGGHNISMIGPPGAGKTMLAKRLPGLLPSLTEHDALEVSAVHSVAGTLKHPGALMTSPPFEAPHHSASMAAMVGGGSNIPRPGAVSRAHGGVLFLDEAPEFSPRVLDALRQPLEEGTILVSRARANAVFPARFQLVLAANPCPCGRASTGVGVQHTGHECTCDPMRMRRYQARISGPLLDRIDIHLVVPAPTAVRRELCTDDEHPVVQSSAAARKHITAARERQRQRWADTGYALNAHIPGKVLRSSEFEIPAADCETLTRAVTLGRLSLRGYDRTLRVAWTLADLDHRDRPDREDIAKALHYRNPVGSVAP